MIKRPPQPDVEFTTLEHGALDEAYYYNIVDYAGDLSDYVNITRHKTLAGAIQEAKRFELDRKWAGPRTNTVYAGVPPRIVRTVRFVELHRAEFKGPLPVMQQLADCPALMGRDGDVDFEATHKQMERDHKEFWGQFEIAPKNQNTGKPHPAVSRLNETEKRPKAED